MTRPLRAEGVCWEGILLGLLGRLVFRHGLSLQDPVPEFLGVGHVVERDAGGDMRGCLVHILLRGYQRSAGKRGTVLRW